jgi:hypothetical protein
MQLKTHQLGCRRVEFSCRIRNSFDSSACRIRNGTSWRIRAYRNATSAQGCRITQFNIAPSSAGLSQRCLGRTAPVGHRDDCPRPAIGSGERESHSRHPVGAQSASFVSIRPPCRLKGGASQTLGRFTDAQNAAEGRDGTTPRVDCPLEGGKKSCLFVSYSTLTRESAGTRNSHSCKLQNDAVEPDTASEIVRVSDTKRPARIHRIIRRKFLVSTQRTLRCQGDLRWKSISLENLHSPPP